MATFLDIRSKISDQAANKGCSDWRSIRSIRSNRRFFVHYTRAADGAIVVAEYQASVGNRDAADAAERILLTIPHPTNTNHNGAACSRSDPDGYRYIGVGDGGSGNDPPNNAQNKEVLLGKILRLDVDVRVGGGLECNGIPISNPCFGGIAGRDEIFAYGMRNPWRFSFDRATAQLRVADVGQGAREEVNTPIVNAATMAGVFYRRHDLHEIDRAPARRRQIPGSNLRLPARRWTLASIHGWIRHRAARSDPCRPAPTCTATTAPARSSPGLAASSACFSTPRSASRRSAKTMSASIDVGGSERPRQPHRGWRRRRRRVSDDVAPVALVRRAGATLTVSVSSTTAGRSWTVMSGSEWVSVARTATAAAASCRSSAASHHGWPIPRIGVLTVAGNPWSFFSSDDGRPARCGRGTLEGRRPGMRRVALYVSSVNTQADLRTGLQQIAGRTTLVLSTPTNVSARTETPNATADA